MTLQQKQISSSTISEEVEEGLEFIIDHFDPEILYFPRTIMTKKLGYQKEVYFKEEVLYYFEESNFIDCRINAFRYPNPDLIFIDSDRNNFETDIGLESALDNTLKNIKKKLGGFPTVLETGGGYHIILPIECPMSLENITEFQKFDRPSEQFLRFAKDYFSNGKADKQNNPSFRSCLLRIPGSINSKYNRRVKIVQKWNGIRPPIPREFIEEFRTYLIQKKIDEDRQRQKIMLERLKERQNNKDNTNNRNYYYGWIDKEIISKSFEDYRKIIINLILAPYLVVIKKLSYEESYQIIDEWLQKCVFLRELNFNPKSLINTSLSTAYKKQIPPMSIITLKTNYNDLYVLKKKRERDEK